MLRTSKQITFGSLHKDKKQESKFPTLDPDKERSMIDKFLKKNKVVCHEKKD